MLLYLHALHDTRISPFLLARNNTLTGIRAFETQTIRLTPLVRSYLRLKSRTSVQSSLYSSFHSSYASSINCHFSNLHLAAILLLPNVPAEFPSVLPVSPRSFANVYCRLPSASDTACLNLMLPWDIVNARLTTSTSRS